MNSNDQIENSQPGGLSVVIPTHNGRPSIEGTVRSLLANTYSNLEVIVVCDGDGTATRTVLRAIADSRLRVLEKTKEGASSARNAGLHVAQHDWVAFVDDDDLPRSNWVSTWQEFANPDVVAITAAVERHPEGRSPNTQTCRLDPTDPTMSASTILAGAFWVRRELVSSVGGYDNGLPASENQDLGLRLCDSISAHQSGNPTIALDRVVIDLHIQEAAARDARYGSAPADAAGIFLERYEMRLAADSSSHASLLRVMSRSYRMRGEARLSLNTAIKAWRLEPTAWKNWKSVLLAVLPNRIVLLGRGGLNSVRAKLSRLGRV